MKCIYVHIFDILKHLFIHNNTFVVKNQISSYNEIFLSNVEITFESVIFFISVFVADGD